MKLIISREEDTENGKWTEVSIMNTWNMYDVMCICYGHSHALLYAPAHHCDMHIYIKSRAVNFLKNEKLLLVYYQA